MDTTAFPATQYVCNQSPILNPSVEIYRELSVKVPNLQCGFKIRHDLIPTYLPPKPHLVTLGPWLSQVFLLPPIFQSPSCFLVLYMVPSTWNFLPYTSHLGNFYSPIRSRLKCHFLKEVFFEIPKSSSISHSHSTHAFPSEHSSQSYSYNLLCAYLLHICLALLNFSGHKNRDQVCSLLYP